jgi:hypothetical protein
LEDIPLCSGNKCIAEGNDSMPKRKPKVFIIDDNRIFLTGLARMFEREKDAFELPGHEEYSN